MQYKTGSLIATLLLTALGGTIEANDALLGNWIARLQIPDGPELRIGMEFFERADGSIGANASSPDQGARYMRIESLDIDGDQFTAAIAGMPVIISGQLNDAGELDSQFRQGNSGLPLIFSRINTIPETVRPKTRSLSYQPVEQDVRFYNGKDEVWLSATLTLPSTASAETPVPVVLLLAGSGPADRDEYHFGHRPLKVLAHYLTERGFRRAERGQTRGTEIFR